MNDPTLPEVVLCLAASLDGKIAAKPGAAPDFTSRDDLQKLFRLRAESDALLVGANTVRQEELPALVRDEALKRQRIDAGMPPHPLAVVVSGSLNLPWESRYFSKRRQPIYIMTAAPTPDQRRQIEALELGLLETGERLSFREGLRQLKALGIGKVLAEGGGRLTHSLLAEGLVDRLYLTLAPVIFGGFDTPPLCNGPLLNPSPGFELVDCQKIGSELHLEYRARRN